MLNSLWVRNRDGQPGSTSQIPEPLRGELYSIEHLRSHAVTLARTLTVVPSRESDRRFQQRFRNAAQEIRAAQATISHAIQLGEPLTAEAEWLLDNFHVVEEHLHEIQDDLPPAYFRELPKLQDGGPRTFQLAIELIIHTDSMIQQDDLTAFVNEFQNVTPLSIGELWSLPIMLRMGLVENLRRLSGQMVAGLSSRVEVKRILENWETDTPFPDIFQGKAPDPVLAAQTFTVLRELSLEDTAKSLAIEQILIERYPEVTELIRAEHRRQASNQVSIGNVITSMRLISALDWTLFFEETSLAEKTLRTDPAGIYSLLDPETRDRYRHALEDLAKRSHTTDLSVAQRVVARSQAAASDSSLERHIGFWLIDHGRARLEQEIGYRALLKVRIQRFLRTHPGLAYFGSIASLVACGVVIATAMSNHAGVSGAIAVVLVALSLIPLSEFAINCVNLIITRLLPPQLLPKLELKDGVPQEWRTYVVVPAMLSGRKEIAALLQRLEMHYVGNPESHLRFALLTDFTDSNVEHAERDKEYLNLAIEGIRKLNETYRSSGQKPFALFHRKRLWNPTENLWMGWERKRGKLMEFNRILRGDKETSYIIQEGDLADVQPATPSKSAYPFVITLDADTELPLGMARRMVGTLAHPLNRPQLNAEKTKLIHGYCILQPRVSVKLADARKTLYTRIFANGKGIDPYATAASDVYQDLFSEGSFTGKGIYDVQAFDELLDGAFGQNQILSHDLIEGCHTRVALTSDLEVIDGYPGRYDADLRRNHRWVRGDWQLLPWLFPTVPSESGYRRNRLSFLSRWKILDNLRRSLVSLSLCLLLVVGWLLAPGTEIVWSVIAGLTLGFPVLATASNLLTLPRRDRWRAHVLLMWRDLKVTLLQTLVSVSCLPYRASVMADAIVRTLYRLLLSRRKMLEWETAAATERRLSKNQWSIVSQMVVVPIAGLMLVAFLPLSVWYMAIPWIVAWCLSPFVAHFISQPIINVQPQISEQDQLWLRQIARNTWSYFETCVSDKTNWLPPDNLQEYPDIKLAERISPTNEGLYLVSGLVARDFGFVGLHQLLDLWEKNLASWIQLPRLNGHFFNWYETSNLQPLMPRYVSTVDSGNLAASLLVVRQGVDDYCVAPVVSTATWNGFSDTVAVAIQACEALHPRGARIVSPPLDELCEVLLSLNAAISKRPVNWRERYELFEVLSLTQPILMSKLDGLISSKRHPADDVEVKVRSLDRWIRGFISDFTRLVPWCAKYVELLEGFKKLTDSSSYQTHFSMVEARIEGTLSLDQLEKLSEMTVSDGGTDPGLQEFQLLLKAGAQHAQQLKTRMRSIGQRAERLAMEMQFDFLFNTQRRLFSIGFNLEEGRLDRSHYDMLCSEARLSSHIAIAKGDVSYKHWFQLGRQMTFTAGQQGLLSWGGTMFEFLMPLLFQRSYPESLLTNACAAAVARQKEYGQRQGLPWGISESAYAALAVNSDYQYQSFGVPGLGLKRGLSHDAVIAPYATMLSLSIDCNSAVQNLRLLASEGAIGQFGFYDAIDYTPNRVPATKKALVVRCYMAHHQAMSLAALANVLFDKVIERRFHEHPLIRATEMILQEEMPIHGPRIQPHAEEAAETRTSRSGDVIVSRRMIGYESPYPRSHLLSNGTYSVMVTNSGAGYSQFRKLAVNRWRPDAIRESGGNFLYLRDRKTSQVWSATYLPTCRRPDFYEVIFAIDKAIYRRRDGDIETHLEVAVSPDSQVEVRQLTITNHGSRACELEITSYLEVVLTTHAADIAHPAFQKLFVETEYIAEETTLIARRRPRESHVEPVYGVHVLSSCDAITGAVEYESSREKFLGRGGDARQPAALKPGARLSGTSGFVLDPVFSLRCSVTIQGRASITVAFSTGVAGSREEALQIAGQFHEPRSVQRAFEMAWVFNQVQFQHLQITAAQAQRYQQLAGLILFPQRQTRGPEASLLSNRQGQSGLWRYGISGDRRILLVKIAEADHVDYVRELLMAHEYWHQHGLIIDLVILNTHPGSYLDLLQEKLLRAVQELPRVVTETQESVFVLRASHLTREDQILLETTAHVVIDAKRGWVSAAVPPSPKSIEPPRDVDQRILANRTSRTGLFVRHSSTFVEPAKKSANETDGLEFWNGYGGFYDQGREYRIRLDANNKTPTPWSNVIANPRFGMLVTESGGGFTWSGNSRQNKLTSWSNDPVSDTPSEVLYLVDAVSGNAWCPMAYPEEQISSWVHHGQGYSRWVSQSHGLKQDILVSIAPHDPVKTICLRLTNNCGEVLSLSATYYAELVLGVTREQSQMHLVSNWSDEHQALMVRNSYHSFASEQVAFLKVLGPNCSASANRAEFLGRDHESGLPVALLGSRLSGQTGAGLDTCAAVQSQFQLAQGESIEIVFLLGCGVNADEAETLLVRYKTLDAVKNANAETLSRWNELLDSVQVKTPNRSLDLLVNRWLLYQVTSCRLWGRSGFYQSGGAYGFRDQLQDVMALVYSRPDLTRSHLLRAASRQYESGDVQHWWHPPIGEGTRTRFSDDLLWLPFVAAYYIKVTGDEQLLDEVVPYLASEPLEAGELERYELPQASSERGTLYEHCLRALQKGFRVGEHGLPLMGCGDWNDGMSQVGALGRGESVWVGWFLLVLLDDFLPLCERRGDHATVEHYQMRAQTLRAALDEHGWDGHWYRRAYFDDGTPLGSQQNEECQIDSIVQSWAVFADARSDRTDQAIESVFERLVSDKDRLVALFTPPFDQSTLNPGYIKGYLPGVRENGGQYTHAVLWLIQALAEKGDAERAMRLFDYINPILHTTNLADVDNYRAEPYVIAADVYSIPPHTGRGGWTWYTGSASWAYRSALESLLGMKLSRGRVRFSPCVPSDWKQFQVSLKSGASTHHFEILTGPDVDEELVDNEGQEHTDWIELTDDGKVHYHRVVARSRPLQKTSAGQKL